MSVGVSRVVEDTVDLHSLDRIEALGLLVVITDVGIDQERVDLAMNIFDSDLEAVEAARLGPLDLCVN